jgi:hypothetical protein
VAKNKTDNKGVIPTNHKTQWENLSEDSGYEYVELAEIAIPLLAKVLEPVIKARKAAQKAIKAA